MKHKDLVAALSEKTGMKAQQIESMIDDTVATMAKVLEGNDTIMISGLAAGNYTLTVTTIPDGDHNSVNKTVKVTVING